MSLILDALNRSERERSGGAGDVPELLRPSRQGAPTLRLLLPWLIAALLAALLVLVLLMRDKGKPDAPGPAGAASASSPDAVVTAAGGPGAAKAAVAASAGRPDGAGEGVAAAAPTLRDTAPERAVGDREAVAALYAQAPLAVSSAAELPTRSSQVDPGVRPGGGSGAGALAPRPESERESGVATLAGEPASADGVAAPPHGATQETAVDLVAALERARESVADAGLTPHPTPLLSQRSQQFRDRVPTLMYLRHEYASDGGSTVVLNGKQLRRGQRVEGVQVVEILPDSVILRYDSEDFRLRALNSWINL